MDKLPHYGTVLLVTHGLVSLLHDIAHRSLGIELSLVQLLYVYLVFVIAPILSLVFLWTRRPRAGSVFLLLSMVGSLIFAGLNHFVIRSNDHVLHVPEAAGRSMFQITAILMALIEAIGSGFAFRALLKTNLRTPA